MWGRTRPSQHCCCLFWKSERVKDPARCAGSKAHGRHRGRGGGGAGDGGGGHHGIVLSLDRRSEPTQAPLRHVSCTPRLPAQAARRHPQDAMPQPRTPQPNSGDPWQHGVRNVRTVRRTSASGVPVGGVGSSVCGNHPAYGVGQGPGPRMFREASPSRVHLPRSPLWAWAPPFTLCGAL